MYRLNDMHLLESDQVQWEIGMGAPVLALHQCGFFKHVVATDIDFQVYASAVLFFEILVDQSTSNDDGSEESSRALITKVHDHHYHAERVTRHQKAKLSK